MASAKSKRGTLCVPLFDLVEHRGFEPLTPTLPVLCAPNCANAPCDEYIISYDYLDCNTKIQKNKKIPILFIYAIDYIAKP